MLEGGQTIAMSSNVSNSINVKAYFYKPDGSLEIRCFGLKDAKTSEDQLWKLKSMLRTIYEAQNYSERSHNLHWQGDMTQSWI